MNRHRFGLWICTWLWIFAFSAAGAEPGETTESAVQYVQSARQQGFTDTEIQQKAAADGWNKETLMAAIGAPPVPVAGHAVDRSAEPKGYRIGTGDVLQIVVWKETEASVPSVVVRPDGKITVPLVKEVEAAGLTPQELEILLTEKLARYIRKADVTVIPREIVSQKVYLLGAVRREGPIPLVSSMTVLQALNAGGGLTEYAKKKKIYVLRGEKGKQVRLPFNYSAVIRGQGQEQNVFVRADDTIVVP